MTVPNTFTGGVNTSFSTELNENFATNLKIGQLGLTGGAAIWPRGGITKNLCLTTCSTFEEDIATTTNLTHDPGVNSYSTSTSGSFSFQTPDFPMGSSTDELISDLGYYFFKAYDEFIDGTVSTSLWSTSTTLNGVGAPQASITETGGYVQVYAEGSVSDAEGDGTAELTSQTDFTGSSILVGYYLNATEQSNNLINGQARLQITDGTNTENIRSKIVDDSEDGSISETGILQLYESGGTVYYRAYVDETASSRGSFYPNLIDKVVVEGTIDVSSWSSVKLKAYAFGDSDSVGNVSGRSSGTVRLYYVRQPLASPSSTITLSASANGGTNWTTTGAPVTTVSTSGSSATIKAEGTIASGEGLAIEYAIWGANQ